VHLQLLLNNEQRGIGYTFIKYSAYYLYNLQQNLLCISVQLALITSGRAASMTVIDYFVFQLGFALLTYMTKCAGKVPSLHHGHQESKIASG
jgi:hypothetical protein